MEMPRTERRKSASGIYHVMLRGINHQQLFEDEEDYLRFLSILRECKEVSEYKLYAYCLMGNHVHLLLQEGKESLDLIFKRIGSRFVYWYNLKYQRVGHLFQDRYKSEPVETDAYFLTALRYVLQNPMKAGLEETPGTYGWSSYAAYAGRADGLTNSELAVGMPGEQANLLAYLAEKNEDRLLDVAERKQAERSPFHDARKRSVGASGCAHDRRAENDSRKVQLMTCRQRDREPSPVPRFVGAGYDYYGKPNVLVYRGVWQRSTT